MKYDSNVRRWLIEVRKRESAKRTRPNDLSNLLRGKNQLEYQIEESAAQEPRPSGTRCVFACSETHEIRSNFGSPV